MEWILALILGPPVAFVLSELGARGWLKLKDEYFVHQPYAKVELELDPEALPDLDPIVRHSINADGERGDDLPDDVDAVLRVLVAGGSAAECYLLDQERTWPMVAQKALNQSCERAVHVGNISQSLVPCETIQTVLTKSLDRFRSLDVIVLMVGASDIVGWLEQKTPPSLQPGSRPLRDVCSEHPEGPFGWTKKDLALYRLLRRFNARVRRPVARKSGAGKSLIKNRRMRAEATTLLDEVPDPTPMLSFFEEHLRRLIVTCRSHARRVIVVRQPWFQKEFTPEEQARLWNFGQGRPYVEHLDTYYTHRVVCELMGMVDDVAERVALDAGAEELDLMPLLPKSFDTFYDFLHFTPAGAQIVGEAVARAIAAGEGDCAAS